MIKSYQQLVFRGRFGPQLDAQLEEQFRLQFARKQKAYSRLLLLLMIILFVFFGICDYIILAEEVYRVWIIRYLITVPILLFAFWLLQKPWIDHYYQIYVASVLCLTILSSCLMLYEMPSEAYHLYSSSLLALVMGGLTLIRIGFAGVTFTAGFYVLATGVLQFTYTKIDSVAILYFLLGFLAMVFCMASAFSYESASRNEFYQQLLLEKKHAELEKANKRLQSLVDIDGLTGIANRRRFDHALASEWRRAIRGQYSLALMVVDIDFFKTYNDKLGHLQGDTTLKEVAHALASHTRRPGDLVARFGGEEFAIILPGIGTEEALISANYLCEQVRNLEIRHPDSPISEHITVSIGVAVIVPQQGSIDTDLFRRADEALYLAKQSGRNRVEIAHQQATTRGQRAIQPSVDHDLPV